MGNEYETAPKQVFKDWVNTMLTAGADIVLASHPHVLQPVEFIDVEDADGTVRKCFVAYSLGNFISSQRTKPRDYGMILNLEFSKPEGERATLNRVTYIPTWVKFADRAGVADITVLPVAGIFKSENEAIVANLRAADIERVKVVLAETSKMFLGHSVDNMLPEEFEIFPAEK
jgi:poly-gamma-glutamate synthesis protein (capsule biosynthesis protein)